MSYTLRVRLSEDEQSTLEKACVSVGTLTGSLTNYSDLVRGWIKAGCPTTPEPRMKGAWLHRNLPEDAAYADGRLVHSDEENPSGATGIKFYRAK